MELTSEQAKVLQSIRRVKRAAILGGAGTGKTLLAVEKARQLAAAGFRTVLLCFNAPLRSHLTTVLEASGVEVETFHTLTAREARCAGFHIPSQPPGEWYETGAPRLLTQAAFANGTRYDAVLIDEAQDFGPEWLLCAQSLLRDAEASVLYLFADTHQDLYRRGWSIPPGMVEIELTINCRNTRPIAERVALIFGDVVAGKPPDGPQPKFIEIARNQQIVPYAVGVVESLVLEEGLRTDQIIVLTNSANTVSELRETGVGGHLFTTLEGYGIPVETVFRFKGLEREVVVLALIDRAPMDDLSALLYVGLSRARAALYIVGSSDLKRAIKWNE